MWRSCSQTAPMLSSQILRFLSWTYTPAAHPRHGFCASAKALLGAGASQHAGICCSQMDRPGLWREKDRSESCFHTCLTLTASILHMKIKRSSCPQNAAPELFRTTVVAGYVKDVWRANVLETDLCSWVTWRNKSMRLSIARMWS